MIVSILIVWLSCGLAATVFLSRFFSRVHAMEKAARREH